MKRQTLKKQIWLALVSLGAILCPVVVQGMDTVVTPDVTQNHRARVQESANGVLVVNIRRPNAQGVSHNKYENLQVGEKGLIFNNSDQLVSTKLGGIIPGNPVMIGTSAKTILNEVVGENPSHIRGAMEVAGNKANLVVANPHGIYVDNGTFIHTNRVTLTTGKPIFAQDRWTGISVQGGHVAIEGKGLDGRQASAVDVLSQAIQLNANIWADQLEMVSGNNRIDLDSEGHVLHVTKTEDSKEMGVRVYPTGGIYANQIVLVGTEKGLGVNSEGTINALTGHIFISSEGIVSVTGKISGKKSVEIQGNTLDVKDTGTIVGKEVSITGHTIRNTGTMQGEVLYLHGGTITNEHKGRMVGDTVAIEATTLHNLGVYNSEAPVIYGKQHMFMGVQTLENTEHALIRANHGLYIGGTLTKGSSAPAYTVSGMADSVSNQSAQIESKENLSIQAKNVLNRNLHYSTKKEEIARETRDEVAGSGAPERYNDWDKKIYPNGQVPPNVVARYNDESIHLSVYGKGYEEWWRYQYERRTIADVVDHTDPGTIVSGKDMTLSAASITNDKSRILAGGHLSVTSGEIQNINPPGETVHEDTGMATSYWRHHRRGTDDTGSHTQDYHHTTTIPYQVPMATQGEEQEAVPFKEAPKEIPPSALYTVTPSVTASYYLETDPAFTDKETVLSSDYFFSQLQADPNRVAKRLGDGFYEREQINDQVFRLTGKRYVDGVQSESEQLKKLYDAGIAYAKQSHASIGVALSKEAQEQLHTDIVWMVETSVVLPNGKVVHALVPRVYLAKEHRHLDKSVAVISATQTDVKVANSILNMGTLIGRDGLHISATDILNQGGTVSGEKVSLVASHNIENKAGSILGDKRVSLVAGNDIAVQAGLVETTGKDSQLHLEAGRDIKLDTITMRSEDNIVIDARNARREQRSEEMGSVLGSNGSMALTAKRNIEGTAVTLGARDDLNVKAGGDISFKSGDTHVSLQEDHYHVGQTGGGGRQVNESHQTYESHRAIESAILGNRIHMESGGHINAVGARMIGKQEVQLQSGKDIHIEGSQHTLETTTEMHELKRGFLSRSQTDVQEHQKVNTIEKALVQGDAVSFKSQGNVTVTASDVLGNNLVTIEGKQGVAMRTKEARNEVTRILHTKESGLSTTGLGIHIGKETLDTSEHDVTSTPIVSHIGSSAGAVQIASTGTVSGEATSVIAKKDIDIRGASVSLTGAKQLSTHDAQMTYAKRGISLSLGGSVPSMLQTVSAYIDKGSKRKDKLLSTLEYGEGLRALKKGREDILDYVSLNKENLLREGNALQNQGKVLLASGNAFSKDASMRAAGHAIRQEGQQYIGQGNAKVALANHEEARKQTQSTKRDQLVNVHIGVASQSAKENVHTREETYEGSLVQSKEGEVHIVATLPDDTTKIATKNVSLGTVKLEGSHVQGNMVTIKAEKDLHALAGVQHKQSLTDSNNKGWSVGASIGLTGFLGADVSVNKGQGNGTEEATTHVMTSIEGRQGVAMKAKGDTRIQGARVEGDHVEIHTGNNLTITSVQDTETKREIRTERGIQVSFDQKGITGGMAHQGNSQATGNYASVTEQSGIYAGTKGFDVSVQGDTVLAGAVLSSTGTPEVNQLETSSLTLQHIHNRAKQDQTSQGIGYSYGRSYNQAKKKVESGSPLTKEETSILNEGYNKMGGYLDLLPNVQKEASSVTKSAISPSMIRTNEVVDLGSIPRDTTGTLHALMPLSEKESLKEQQELARLFSKNMNEAVHRLGAHYGWRNGSGEKVALHAITGGIGAKLSGNSFTSGSVSGGLNEWAIPKLEKIVGADHPDQMELGSAALGYVTNKVLHEDPLIGATIARYGTKWNRYLLFNDSTALQVFDAFLKTKKGENLNDTEFDEVVQTIHKQVQQQQPYRENSIQYFGMTPKDYVDITNYLIKQYPDLDRESIPKAFKYLNRYEREYNKWDNTNIYTGAFILVGNNNIKEYVDKRFEEEIRSPDFEATQKPEVFDEDSFNWSYAIVTEMTSATANQVPSLLVKAGAIRSKPAKYAIKAGGIGTVVSYGVSLKQNEEKYSGFSFIAAEVVDGIPIFLSMGGAALGGLEGIIQGGDDVITLEMAGATGGAIVGDYLAYHVKKKLLSDDDKLFYEIVEGKHKNDY